jgi:hypothetical protein
MKKYILLLSAVLLVTSVSFASENVGARPAALGGAFVAVADDANAIFENPAGIGLLHGEHVVISNKISGDEYTVIGGVQETPVGNFGIGYISSSSPIEGLNATAVDDSGEVPVRALNQALVLSYGREFNRFSVVPKFMGRLSLGANVKISNNILTKAKGTSERNGSLVNADLAVIFKLRDEVSLAMNIRNCLNSTDARGDEFGLVLGASAKLLKKVSVSVTTDGNVGIEFKPVPLFAFRVGRDEGNSTLGAGVNLNGFGIDYAYRNSEDPIHYVGISLAFNS